jgi:hypothetical protein
VSDREDSQRRLVLFCTPAAEGWYTEGWAEEEARILSLRSRNGLEVAELEFEFMVASPAAGYSCGPRAVNGESGGVVISTSEQEESVGKKLM